MASTAAPSTQTPSEHSFTLTSPLTPTDSAHGDEAPRGRLKRRRLSSHTPPRASSPSRGHDRASGSRHRQHYRKHQRASSSSSPFIEAPPHPIRQKNRRRSDAEPDHTFRGRVRNRSGSGGRSRSPILEGKEERVVKKRSLPPSRGPAGAGGGSDEEGEGRRVENAVRRLRSYPNLYRQGGERMGKEAETAVASEVD
ncbi:hypothetical protein BU23DRAFT_548487 [Bimuria novae-zelandiae CBS 107.79]|uniref:Uncharacterized protein n=1 Tax=Bimuria novae-zelandiae CBS 107.79 TaxID=1447943 RepID=A0A6A5W4B5_9PLEO|nr:hypothetical protein BU23DRAFT_548487 [Bimuria novae-zelandiae CBS 107.79]